MTNPVIQTLIKISKPIFILILISLIISSCANKKDIIYLQDIEKIAASDHQYQTEAIINPNDILTINVNTFDMEAAAPFNLILPARTVQEQTVMGSQQMQGYIVNNDGTIEFPVLGTIQAGGLTRMELEKKLRKELSEYLVNPIVNIRISNYKVTVLGEVNRPGTYPINSERITLLEAIGMAGDLNIYGVRDNILILREVNGVKSYNRVDITSSEFLESPFYYLAQNDVVYVEPNRAQVGGAAYNRNTSVYISIASVLISLILLISRM